MPDGFGQTGGTRGMHDESAGIRRIESGAFRRNGISGNGTCWSKEAFVANRFDDLWVYEAIRLFLFVELGRFMNCMRNLARNEDSTGVGTL